MRAEDTEPIFIHPGDNSLANKIFACTGVQVEENAAVGPTSICISCKTSVYKSYQFLELCQRSNKIIKNLFASQQKSSESTRHELRMVIRTSGANRMPTVQRKRTNSRRKSNRSNLEQSTSASDVSWSENDDEKEDDGDDDVEEPPAKRTIQQISNDSVEELSFNEEGESSQMDTGNEQPKGRNASKLQKTDGTETLQLAKAGMLLAEAATKKTQDSAERTKALKRIACHSIMSVDVSGCNAVAQEYYKLEQRRIVSETYEDACRDKDAAESSVAPASALSEEAHNQNLDSNESFDENNETSVNILPPEFLDS